MKTLPWLLLTLWSAWLHGLQGWLADSASWGVWMPEIGLVLLVALAATLPMGDLPALGLAVALGRIAVSVDPPLAVIAAALAVVALVRTLRSVVDVKSALPRAAITGLAALGTSGWLALVQREREFGGVLLASAGSSDALSEFTTATWGPLVPFALGVALSTALAALVFGPALTKLPGLAGLRRRRTWHSAASGLWS